MEAVPVQYMRELGQSERIDGEQVARKTSITVRIGVVGKAAGNHARSWRKSFPPRNLTKPGESGRAIYCTRWRIYIRPGAGVDVSSRWLPGVEKVARPPGESPQRWAADKRRATVVPRMIQRIAALLALGPRLDALYQAASSRAFTAELERLNYKRKKANTSPANKNLHRCADAGSMVWITSKPSNSGWPR